MSVRTLLVGLGQIGMGYDLHAESKMRVATLARAFSEHPAFTLVGGVDPNPVQREIFSTRYRSQAFADIRTALAAEAPDLIVIAVPTEAHYSVWKDSIQSPSIKAILCEKPISYKLDEAEEMVSVSSQKKIRLYTNYMRRCDSGIISVRNRIQQGEIKGPIKGVCWYSKGLYNNGSHYLNLFQFLLGKVVGFEVINSGRVWHGVDPEPDLKIRFESGEIYFHAAHDENFSYHRIELIASNGRLEYYGGKIRWQKTIHDLNNANYIILDNDFEEIQSDTARLQFFVADQIYRDMSGLDSSICTGEQGLSTIKILDEIKKRL
jgi:predicted dehydrogenase